MTLFSEVWGGGRGRMQAFAPSARLACGAFAFASCAAAPLNGPWGVSLISGVLVGWTVLCGIPLRRLAALLRFAILLFAPLLLLAPLALFQKEGDTFSDALRVALLIGLRGTACLVVCAAAMSSLELAELGQGLAGLRLPRAVTALVMQVAHQTALLTDESRRMVMALRVRGAASAGTVPRLRCLFALPVIWLLRLLQRAERVSAAMEVRGFEGPLIGESAGLSAQDLCAMAAGLAVLGAVLFLRWGAK